MHVAVPPRNLLHLDQNGQSQVYRIRAQSYNWRTFYKLFTIDRMDEHKRASATSHTFQSNYAEWVGTREGWFSGARLPRGLADGASSHGSRLRVSRRHGLALDATPTGSRREVGLAASESGVHLLAAAQPVRSG